MVGLPKTLFTYDFDPTSNELKINSEPELKTQGTYPYTIYSKETECNEAEV